MRPGFPHRMCIVTALGCARTRLLSRRLPSSGPKLVRVSIIGVFFLFASNRNIVFYSHHAPPSRTIDCKKIHQARYEPDRSVPIFMAGLKMSAFQFHGARLLSGQFLANFSTKLPRPRANCSSSSRSKSEPMHDGMERMAARVTKGIKIALNPTCLNFHFSRYLSVPRGAVCWCWGSDGPSSGLTFRRSSMWVNSETGRLLYPPNFSSPSTTLRKLYVCVWVCLCAHCSGGAGAP